MYYRMVSRRELPNILTHGLIPSERTGDIPNQPDRVTRRIHLLEDPDESEYYGEVLLEVTIPPGVRVRSSVNTEGVYVTQPISSEYIRVLRK